MTYTSADHTFVICAYGESPYLEECICSLEEQTVKTRVIIVTSTPCPFIKDIARTHGIMVTVNTGEKGIAGDWNFALQSADTRLVTIAHQDDVYLPDYAEEMLKAINAESHPLIAFSDYGEMRGKDIVYKNKLLNIKKILLLPFRFKCFRGSIFVRRRSLSWGSGICCPSVTYVMENLPGFAFVPGFRSNIDWQAWETISRRRGQFVYCCRPLMLHRIHKDSETSKIIADQQRRVEDYEMFCKFWPDCISRLIVKFYSRGEKSNEL